METRRVRALQAGFKGYSKIQILPSFTVVASKLINNNYNQSPFKEKRAFYYGFGYVLSTD